MGGWFSIRKKEIENLDFKLLPIFLRLNEKPIINLVGIATNGNISEKKINQVESPLDRALRNREESKK